ncbi:hypothetical protein, partial [Solidesulfovibrio sp.]|uniref:hypothetical protein n=1 Tax=Solidesulfovibrio sp. TaxID=2910990 RepID=UPI002B1F27AA
MKDREACGHLFDEVSVLLNTYFDIEFFKLISFAPSNAHEYVNDKYFESLGHSYRITYEVVRWLISVSCKEDSDLFTVPCEWQSEFIKLRDRKVEGFYYGSPVQLSPVGGLAIFEGQARFSQLVYLYRASRGSCSWDQFRKAGYLSGIYVEAFQVFLTLLDEEWPSEISDPLIGLFLLICDLAINPTEGFLLEVIDYSS